MGQRLNWLRPDELERTFKELKIGDFVYEIKKSYSDLYALMWKLTSEFNRDTESEHLNSYLALGKDPDDRLSERAIVVSANSFGKSSYNNVRLNVLRETTILWTCS